MTNEKQYSTRKHAYAKNVNGQHKEMRHPSEANIWVSKWYGNLIPAKSAYWARHDSKM